MQFPIQLHPQQQRFDPRAPDAIHDTSQRGTDRLWLGGNRDFTNAICANDIQIVAQSQARMVVDPHRSMAMQRLVATPLLPNAPPHRHAIYTLAARDHGCGSGHKSVRKTLAAGGMTAVNLSDGRRVFEPEGSA
jgi:hypothetical protein